MVADYDQPTGADLATIVNTAYGYPSYSSHAVESGGTAAFASAYSGYDTPGTGYDPTLGRSADAEYSVIGAGYHPTAGGGYETYAAVQRVQPAYMTVDLERDDVQPSRLHDAEA